MYYQASTSALQSSRGIGIAIAIAITLSYSQFPVANLNPAEPYTTVINFSAERCPCTSSPFEPLLKSRSQPFAIKKQAERVLEFQFSYVTVSYDRHGRECISQGGEGGLFIPEHVGGILSLPRLGQDRLRVQNRDRISASYARR